MALTNDTDLRITGGNQDAMRKLAASEVPYVGSALITNASGYAEVLDSANLGRPFAGHSMQRVESSDHPSSPADGDINISVTDGIYVGAVTISGVAQDDVAHRRLVYATDDGTYTFTAKENTLVGMVIGLDGSDAIVLFASADYQHVLLCGMGVAGIETLDATGNQTLTTGQLGKLLLIPNTAALTLTLPAAADCAGRGFIIKKTTADAQIVTIDGNGAEEIDGATTSTVIDAAQDMLGIVCDGAAWHITQFKIA